MSILSLSLLFSYPVLCTRSGCCRHFHTARSEEGSIWFSPTVNIIKYITVPASIVCDTAAPSVHRITGFSERIKLSLNSFPLSTTPGPHRCSCCHWNSLSLVKDYTERYVGVHYGYSLPFSQPDPVSHSSLRTFFSVTCVTPRYLLTSITQKCRTQCLWLLSPWNESRGALQRRVAPWTTLSDASPSETCSGCKERQKQRQRHSGALWE